MRRMQTIVALAPIASRPASRCFTEILCNGTDRFLRADVRVQRRTIRLALFLVAKFFTFGGFLKIGIELRSPARPKPKPCEAAPVPNRHDGLVHCPLDVVIADVISENRPRDRVGLLRGRADKTIGSELLLRLSAACY